MGHSLKLCPIQSLRCLRHLRLDQELVEAPTLRLQVGKALRHPAASAPFGPGLGIAVFGWRWLPLPLCLPTTLGGRGRRSGRQIGQRQAQPSGFRFHALHELTLGAIQLLITQGFGTKRTLLHHWPKFTMHQYCSQGWTSNSQKIYSWCLIAG